MNDTGSFEIIALDCKELSVRLVPAFGARIISLTDRRTGRDWISAGPSLGSPDRDAVFGPETATGWDECFPTVSPCHSSAGTPLRDHGDLWGRPWTITDVSRQETTAVFEGSSYKFGRTLRLEGNSLLCDYVVVNASDRPLEFLWAMHALFALTPQDRIKLPFGTPGLMTFRSDGQKACAVSWPDGAEFPLDAIQSVERRFAAKLLFDTAPATGVRIEGPAGSLQIEAQKPFASALGLWLCYGGWPGAEGVHQVAIEPTNAPADDLSSAHAIGRATLVPAWQSVSWWTRLTVGTQSHIHG
jgi:galactose mutarotase-like enzyme